MSRYIDADAFDIVGYIVPHGMDFDSFEAGVNHVMNIIHNTPTSDVVDVVRCKDCKHSKIADYIPAKCPYFCKLMANCHSGNFFCSMGERRADEQIH